MDNNDLKTRKRNLNVFVEDKITRMRPKKVVDPRIQTKSHYVLGDNVAGSGGSSVSDFTDLDDTPSAYTGEGTKTVSVTSGEDGLEFITTHQVKVSSDDTTAKYLEDGFSAGRGIALATQNPAGNENVNIECDADYDDISTNDAATDISGAELETLSDGSNADALHTHTLSAPGGNDTEIQFNDGGSFGGDSGLVFDKTNDQLGIAGNVSATPGRKLMVHGDSVLDGDLNVTGSIIIDDPPRARLYLNGAQLNLVHTVYTKVLERIPT